MLKKSKSFFSKFWKIIVGITVVVGLLSSFFIWPKYDLFHKKIKNKTINKYPIDFNLGAFRYSLDEYNIILCDTFKFNSHQVLFQNFPFIFENTTTEDIEDFRFKVFYSNNLYPRFLPKKKVIPLYHDSTFESGRTEDFFTFMYKNITLHPNESYNATEDFLLLPLNEFIKDHHVDVEYPFSKEKPKIKTTTASPILTNKIDVFYSAKNLKEQHKKFRIGKLYANNWDSIVYRYVKELQLSKKYFLELNIKQKNERVIPINTKARTYLILNTINKTDDKKVYTAKVVFENVAIVREKDEKLYIESYKDKIRYFVDLKKNIIINYSE